MRNVILLIVDGWGVGEEHQLNPYQMAKHPVIDSLEHQYAFGTLQSSGVSVGLPWRERGGSEVGHLTIGIGKVYFQDIVRIDNLIASGEFLRNQKLRGIFGQAAQSGRSVHLVGALSGKTDTVSTKHLTALLETAKQEGFHDVQLHLFLDSGREKIRELLIDTERTVRELGVGNIATVAGGIYGLNESGEWIKSARAYKLLAERLGTEIGSCDAIPAMDDYATAEPFIVRGGKTITEGDSVVFFHFQGNTLKQLIECFLHPQPPYLPQEPVRAQLATLVRYQKTWPVDALFPQPAIGTSIVRELSVAQRKVLKIAETAKANLMTFYLNGLTEEHYPFEYQKIFSAPTREEELSVAFNTLQSALQEKAYSLIVMNLSVFDKVFHGGTSQEAADLFAKFDEKLDALVPEVVAEDAVLVMTSDHGCVERMMNPYSGQRETAHSTNPSPVFIVGKEFSRTHSDTEVRLARANPMGGLSDIAPTVLQILGMRVPAEMTGHDLTTLL